MLAIGLVSLFISGKTISQEYQWANGIGSGLDDNAYWMTKDILGNIYIAGSFEGTVDFDPGIGVANLISSGNIDVFFAKYYSSGNYLWANNIGGSSSDIIRSVIIDDFGNIYIGYTMVIQWNYNRITTV